MHFILRENMENYKILVIKGGLKSDKVETNYSNLAPSLFYSLIGADVLKIITYPWIPIMFN